MKTLVCFGDSNTHGASPQQADGSWFRYDRQTRWPSRLAQGLGADWHVVDDGLPGRTTCHDNPFDGPHKNGMRHVPVVLECHAPIDLFLIMLGTNDLKGFLGLTPLDIAKGLRRIVEKVQASGAGPEGRAPQIMLVTPAPILECGPFGETLKGGAEKSRRLEPLVAALAQDCGALYFDAGAVAAVCQTEGVHLTPKAHEALAESLLKHLTDCADQGLI